MGMARARRPRGRATKLAKFSLHASRIAIDQQQAARRARTLARGIALFRCRRPARDF
eukprot:SAG31_NODE_1953_length_6829_cov_6.548886_1_plen_57_part_00